MGEQWGAEYRVITIVTTDIKYGSDLTTNPHRSDESLQYDPRPGNSALGAFFTVGVNVVSRRGERD